MGKYPSWSVVISTSPTDLYYHTTNRHYSLATSAGADLGGVGGVATPPKHSESKNN